jgi:hypothetical protein
MRKRSEKEGSGLRSNRAHRTIGIARANPFRQRQARLVVGQLDPRYRERGKFDVLTKKIDAEALQASFRSLIGSAEWGHMGSNGVVLTV